MRVIPTGAKGEFIYGAPQGMDDEVGGLPCTRERIASAHGSYTAIFSVWEPSAEEREAIAAGANLRLGIIGEPIPPVSLSVTDATSAEADPEDAKKKWAERWDSEHAGEPS